VELDDAGVRMYQRRERVTRQSAATVVPTVVGTELGLRSRRI
jgi:hypothetical protein